MTISKFLMLILILILNLIDIFFRNTIFSLFLLIIQPILRSLKRMISFLLPQSQFLNFYILLILIKIQNINLTIQRQNSTFSSSLSSSQSIISRNHFTFQIAIFQLFNTLSCIIFQFIL